MVRFRYTSNYLKAGFGLSLLTEGKQVSIPEGTLIVFRLRQPFAIEV